VRVIRLALAVIGLVLTATSTCGPARADQLDRAMHVLCGARGDAIVDTVRAEARHHLLHPIVLAQLVAAESRCKVEAKGAAGEIGLGQIKPDGSAARGRTVAQLRDPAINLHLTAAHLARLEVFCGGIVGALSVYSGRRQCRESSYSKRVLGMLRAAEIARAKARRS
jgi:hypothetical protein